jgi:hypothetical protein
VSFKKQFSKFCYRFKKKFKQHKQETKSKRKSFFIGFGTMLSFFGVIMLSPVVAIAKDNILKIKPTDDPSANEAPSQEIINSLAGEAATYGYHTKSS